MSETDKFICFACGFRLCAAVPFHTSAIFILTLSNAGVFAILDENRVCAQFYETNK